MTNWYQSQQSLACDSSFHSSTPHLYPSSVPPQQIYYSYLAQPSLEPQLQAPPPLSMADPNYHQLPVPPPPGPIGFSGQFQYHNPSPLPWAPPPPPDAPYFAPSSYSRHHQYPHPHTPPVPPPHFPHSQFTSVGRMEENQYPIVDPYHSDVQHLSLPASSYQLNPPSVPYWAPESASFNSRYVPDGHLVFSGRNGTLIGDSNTAFHHLDCSPSSLSVHQQEVPSSYSFVAGKDEVEHQVLVERPETKSTAIQKALITGYSQYNDCVYSENLIPPSETITLAFTNSEFQIPNHHSQLSIPPSQFPTSCTNQSPQLPELKLSSIITVDTKTKNIATYHNGETLVVGKQNLETEVYGGTRAVRDGGEDIESGLDSVLGIQEGEVKTTSKCENDNKEGIDVKIVSCNTLKALSVCMKSYSVKIWEENAACKECGKDFDSIKALFGHMSCYSKRLGVSSKSDYEIACSIRKKRSRTIYNKVTPNPSCYNLNGTSSTMFTEADEVKQVAMCVMMLSMGLRSWDEFNLITGSSNYTNSTKLEAQSLLQSKENSRKEDGLKVVCDDGEIMMMKEPRENLDSWVLVYKNGYFDLGVASNDEQKAEWEAFVDKSLGRDKFKESPDNKKGISPELELMKELVTQVGTDQDDLQFEKSKSSKKSKFFYHDFESEGNSYDDVPAYSEFLKNFKRRRKFKCGTCDKVFHSCQAPVGHRSTYKIVDNCIELNLEQSCRKSPGTSRLFDFEVDSEPKKMEWPFSIHPEIFGGSSSDVKDGHTKDDGKIHFGVIPPPIQESEDKFIKQPGGESAVDLLVDPSTYNHEIHIQNSVEKISLVLFIKNQNQQQQYGQTNFMQNQQHQQWLRRNQLGTDSSNEAVEKAIQLEAVDSSPQDWKTKTQLKFPLEDTRYRTEDATATKGNEFEDYFLKRELIMGIYERAFERPCPVQEESISIALTGSDILVIAKNGTGKTVAFCIPELERINQDNSVIQVVVLVPTRELALQTSQVCKKFRKQLKIQVMVTIGRTNLKYDIMRLYQPAQLLVGTPGRILDLAKKGICDLKNYAMLAMDKDDKLDFGVQTFNKAAHSLCACKSSNFDVFINISM